MRKIIFILILVAIAAVGIYFYSGMIDYGASGVAPQNTVKTLLYKVNGPLGIAQDPNGNEYLTDKSGMTLYFNSKDENSGGKITPTCKAECEKAWHPYFIGESDRAYGSTTTDPLLSKINFYKRADGQYQYALGTKPLYYSSLDKKAGDITPAVANWTWEVARP